MRTILAVMVVMIVSIFSDTICSIACAEETKKEDKIAVEIGLKELKKAHEKTLVIKNDLEKKIEYKKLKDLLIGNIVVGEFKVNAINPVKTKECYVYANCVWKKKIYFAGKKKSKSLKVHIKLRAPIEYGVKMKKGKRNQISILVKNVRSVGEDAGARICTGLELEGGLPDEVGKGK